MASDTASTVMKPKTGGNDLPELGARAKDMAQDRWDQVREGASDAADKVQDKAKEVEHSVEKFVQEQPVKALLIAAGAGIFLGRFLMR